LLDHLLDLINDSETGYQLPPDGIVGTDIERVMTIPTLLPTTPSLGIWASFMASHVSITLPLLESFPQYHEVFSVTLEAVNDDITEFLATES
jgi:hypothetical protein